MLDAHTGAVLAMVGGENYHRNQFNLATQGERQPGSSFKPFVLATALRQNVAPSSVLNSAPVTINADGRLWKVNNYEGEYLGRIDLTQAIAYSDNSVFSQLTALVGPRNVRDTARALGITTKLNGYFAIGLGAEPATPLEMARAYASFADGGFRVDGSVFGNQPRAITKIQDSKGHVTPNGVVAHEVLTPTRPRRSNQLLQGVVQYGTGKAAAAARAAGGGQDRDDRELRRRVVRRLHAPVRGRRLGRLPGQARPDDRPSSTASRSPAARSRRLIWKAFMQKALAEAAGPRRSRHPPTATPRRSPWSTAAVVLERDDGVCHNTAQLEFFGGEVLNNGGNPARVATCKANEVEIPDTVGDVARERTVTAGGPAVDGTGRLQARPHRSARSASSSGSSRRRGTASAGDQITIVLPKSLHGVVPNLVGLPLQRAEAKLARLKLDVSTAAPSAARSSSSRCARIPRRQPGEQHRAHGRAERAADEARPARGRNATVDLPPS